MQTSRIGLTRAVERRGIGLHGGRPCRATLGPGARLTLNGTPVDLDAVTDGAWATTLTTAGGPVRTVEHLLAALVGCGVDDAAITIEGGEAPILDGSAAPWVAAIEAAGPTPRPGARPVHRVTRPLTVGDGDRWIRITPAARLELAVAIDFPLIGRQRFEAPASAFAAVADARTFGFLRDRDRLRAAGLARGAALDNTVVFADDGRPLAALRHPDEPARHKWLDLLGDLALLGRPLIARVEAHCAGHALHHRLVAALREPGATDRPPGDP